MLPDTFLIEELPQARFAGELSDSVETNALQEPVLTIFPNPSNGVFQYCIDHIEEGEFVNIQLIDLSGRVVFEQSNMLPQGNLSLDYLANGMYLCKVLMQNASQTQFVWKLRIEQ